MGKIKCQMCGVEVRSLSPMRKWCVDCRRKLTVIRARDKKLRLRVFENR